MAILGNIPWREYAALPGMSITRLKPMRKSPLHFKSALARPFKVTDEMRFGIGSHLAVYEPDQFPLRCVVWDGKRRAGKEWDAFCEAAGDKTILTVEQYERCCRLRDAVRSHPVASRFVTKGKAEVAITWTDPDTGIDCKGRIDYLTDVDVWLVDLKTTASIEPRLFQSVSERLGYHIQLAAYNMGLAQNTGELAQVAIVAAEAEEPHDVAVYVLEPDILARGEAEFLRLLGLYADCAAKDEWPGQFPILQRLELPPWATALEDDPITFGGERATL